MNNKTFVFSIAFILFYAWLSQSTPAEYWAIVKEWFLLKEPCECTENISFSLESTNPDLKYFVEDNLLPNYLPGLTTTPYITLENHTYLEEP